MAATEARQRTNLIIRVSDEYMTWLDRMAEHCRLSKSDMIDQVLCRFAREIGFDLPPKRS